MINSDLIQTLVIDRPNLRINNREKITAEIYSGDLQKLQKIRFLNVFKTFLPKSCLRQLEALINSFNDY